jgi:hypothetical protein
MVVMKKTLPSLRHLVKLIELCYWQIRSTLP